MIAWICIAEACMSYNALIEVINPMIVICYIGSYKIFGMTTGKDETEYVRLANIQC